MFDSEISSTICDNFVDALVSYSIQKLFLSYQLAMRLNSYSLYRRTFKNCVLLVIQLENNTCYTVKNLNSASAGDFFNSSNNTI